MRLKTFVTATVVLQLFFCGSLLSAQGSSSKPLRIGVVDLQVIFNESELGKKKIAELQKLEERYRAEILKKQGDIRDKEDQLQQLPFSISEEKRLNLAREIEAERIAIKRMQSDAERDLSTRQNDAMMEIYSKIVPVIEAIGQTQGYALVINKVQPSVLLYWDKSVDITQEVIQRFNQTGGKGAR
jgi:outer membrane protein